MRAGPLVLPLLLIACGPMPAELATEQCTERARGAAGPTGMVGIGVGSGGPAGKVEVGITSDYLTGRDPHEVYDRCMRQLTGQGPIRPLVLD